MLFCKELIDNVMGKLQEFSGQDITADLLDTISTEGTKITHQYFPNRVGVKAVVLPEELSQVRIYFIDEFSDHVLMIDDLEELFKEYWISNTFRDIKEED